MNPVNVGVFPERPLHERHCVRVRDVLLRGPVHVVAEQLVAVVQGVLRVVVHAALDVLRQLAAVILRHGLHQSLDEDAFGSLRRDILGQQVNLASRVADFLFCHRQNVFVTSQTVGLPHDEGMRTDFGDFRQHLLEPRSCVRGAGYCRVLILLHDFEARAHPPIRGQGRAAGRCLRRFASGTRSDSTLSQGCCRSVRISSYVP